MKSATFCTNRLPACNADCAKPVAHSPTAVSRFDNAPPIRSGSCWNHSMTDWNAVGSVCVKKFAMFWPRPVTKSTAFCHAEERNDVNAAHALRPVSVLVQNQTRPATSAAIAVTNSMIGFAFMAAFNSHWAAVAAFRPR